MLSFVIDFRLLSVLDHRDDSGDRAPDQRDLQRG